jgi:excinuclease ABC subunit B
VAILDADKEGFLRSTSALIQNIGRAARHIHGQVILYADRITEAMKNAIEETNRRREIQEAYNKEHGIEPATIMKEIHDLTERLQSLRNEPARGQITTDEEGTMPISPAELTTDELSRLVKDLEAEMKKAAKSLEFEKAAVLRDQIIELRQTMVLKRNEGGELSMSLVRESEAPPPGNGRS